MKNFENTTSDITDQLSLMISAKKACTGTISNPNTGWSVPFSISAGGLVKIIVDPNHCYNENSDVIENRGLYVTSTDTISLFASNYENRSFDITNVLPVTSLADEYIVQMYNSAFNGAEFVIIANEDNTIIDITPTANTAGGNPANVTFDVTLNRGQTYQLITSNPTGNFSGTYIKSRDCKKIAVFNGNVLTQVPFGYEAGDHLFEQAIPIAYWGKEFAITNTSLRNSDRVIITASKDNTQILQNGTLIATLNARQLHEIELTSSEASCFIETSEPCAVYLYLVGNNYGGGIEGDPSMLWVSPVEQKIREITFATYETNEIRTHFVNIIVATSDKNTVTLDGTDISSSFTPLTGNPSLSFARKLISHSTHTLKSSRGVTAHVYGLGYRESYAYSVGSAMEDLQRIIWINDEAYSLSMFADRYICMENPIKFYVTLNYQHQNITWDFGDGETDTGDTVYHQYQNPGTYQITAIVERITADECSGSFYDTVTAQIHTTDYTPITEFYDEICPGSVYNNHGYTFVAVSDTVMIDTIPTEICDSLVYVYVNVLPVYNDTITDTICLGDRYNENGFDITPTSPGIVNNTKHIATQKGCDSIITLQLTVNPVYRDTINGEICLGEPYNDNGFNVTPVESGLKSYTQYLTAENGCDSIRLLILNVLPYYYDTINQYICSNDTTIPQGTVLNSTTTNHVTEHGCDSIVTIQDIHCYVYSDTVNDTVCMGERYNQNGLDTVPDQLGIIHDTINYLSIYNCDSIIYLNIIVLQSYNDTINDTICLGDTYNGYNFDTIPEQAGDFTLTYTGSALNGCDSIFVVNLVVNTTYLDSITVEPGDGSGIVADTVIHYTATNGCDSTIVVDYVGPSGGGNGGGGVNFCTFDTINDEICLGDHYNENGFDTIPYKVGTVKYWRFMPDTINHCDSLVTLFLEVLPVYYDTTEIAVCSTDTTILQGTILRDSIAYLFTDRGCDSTLTYLFVHCLVYYDTIDDTICLGDRYIDDNFDTIPTQEGSISLSKSYPTVSDCDSIFTLNLKINPSYHDTLRDTICLGDRYYNPEYNIDTIPEQAGPFIYSQNLSTTESCDSIIRLELEVWQSYNYTKEVVVCTYDTAIAPGTFWKDTTEYYVIAHGCDSIVTFEYRYYRSYDDTIKATTCENHRYNENGFNILPDTVGIGFYTHNPKTTKGCDSIVTLELTVYPEYHNTYYDTICLNDSYNKYGFDTILEHDGNFILVNNDTTINGCDSITTVFLKVNPVYNVTFEAVTCSGELYDGHGFNMIPEEEGDFTFTRIDTARNGCDSTTTLRLTVYPSYHDSFEIVICEQKNAPQSLPWKPKDNFKIIDGGIDPPLQLMNYTFTQDFETKNGCDSTITILYNFYPAYYDTIIAEICLGDRYKDDEENPNFDTIPPQAGYIEYSKKYETIKGCDSIFTLQLTINPVYFDTITATICLGDRYIDDEENPNFDTIPTQAGYIEYSRKYETAKGCDSIFTLQLTINPSYYDTITAEICLGEGYSDANFDTIPPQAGYIEYSKVYTTTKGCDSIFTLKLTINPVYKDTLNINWCLGEIYNENGFDITPTQTGKFTFVNDDTTVKGCDSITTLILTVDSVYYHTINAEICLGDTYNENGFNVTTASTGIISQTIYLESIKGCDSIVTLQLTTNPVYFDTITATVCLGDNYNLYGFDVTPTVTGISYYSLYHKTVKGCDSIINLQLTVNPSYTTFIKDTIYEDEWSYVGNNRYNTPGIHVTDYKTRLGCDSIIYLDLYVMYYPPEITAFSPFNKDGVNDYLYPGFKVQIFNRYGVIIYETKNREQMELGWDGRNNKGQQVEPGLYFYILYKMSGKPHIKSSVEVLKK
jgi:hypothetical protein